MNDTQLLEALGSKDYLVYSVAENELEAWFDAHPDEAVARAHGPCALALASPSTGARQKVGSTVLDLAPDFTTAFLRHRFMEDERDVTQWLLSFCSLPRVNGSLFEANGKKRLPVHEVQGSFQALEKTPEWVALADELRRSAPSTLWTVTTPKPKLPPKKKTGSKPKPRRGAR